MWKFPSLVKTTHLIIDSLFATGSVSLENTNRTKCKYIKKLEDIFKGMIKNTTYQKLLDEFKAVLRGKLIDLKVFLGKEERFKNKWPKISPSESIKGRAN